MKSKLFLGLLLLGFVLSGIKAQTPFSSFRPGQVWTDTDGNPIQAHGGGILYSNGLYYWYGEYRDSLITKNPSSFKGISCYSSKDLYNWKFEGLVLKPVLNNPNHDLAPDKIVERPKVIYNEGTKQFVMWMHVDQKGYKYAHQGVAVSKSATGPFEYLSSSRPNGFESRDMTLFKDTDGKAYVIYSSEDNATMHICQLSDNYLEHTATDKRIFIGLKREAPAIFKNRGKYYLITSACTGWAPNEAQYAMANDILGEWTVLDNPCTGDGSETTFNGQGSFVLPVEYKRDAFIFLIDRWNPKNLANSTYVWLPVQFNGPKLHIRWEDDWKLDFFKRMYW